MTNLTIAEVIDLLISKNAISNATNLTKEYTLAKKSNSFNDMQNVLDHAHELQALYSH